MNKTANKTSSEIKHKKKKEINLPGFVEPEKEGTNKQEAKSRAAIVE